MFGKCIQYAIQYGKLSSSHIIIFFWRVNLFRKSIRRVTSRRIGIFFLFLRGVSMRLSFKLFFISRTTRYSALWMVISFDGGIRTNTVYVFQMSCQVVITYCVIRTPSTFKGIHCVPYIQTTNEGKLRLQIYMYEPSRQASKWASKQACERASKQASEQASKRASKQAGMWASKQASMWASNQASKRASKRASMWASERASKQASMWASKQASKQVSKRASKQASKQACEQASKRVSKQASKRASKQACEQASKHVSRWASKHRM